MKTIFKYGLYLSISLLVCACSRDDTQPQPRETIVYAVGYEQNTDTTTLAKYWANGVEHDLSDGMERAYTYDVYANDQGSVYVAGDIKTDNGYHAALWENGTLTALNETISLSAKSVVAEKEAIYVAGSAKAPSNNAFEAACYWKNSNLTILEDAGLPSTATDIFIAGNDVFLAITTGNEAKIYKNGTITLLSDPSLRASARAVFVSENDTYVVGYQTNTENVQTAILWKNGISQALTDGTHKADAYDVFVSGSDVYVCGYERNDDNISIAKLWKNGTATDLTDGSSPFSYAYSVFVKDEDVYVGGHENTKAVIWKNGQAIILSEGATYPRVQSVFIK